MKLWKFCSSWQLQPQRIALWKYMDAKSFFVKSDHPICKKFGFPIIPQTLVMTGTQFFLLGSNMNMKTSYAFGQGSNFSVPCQLKQPPFCQYDLHCFKTVLFDRDDLNGVEVLKSCRM